MLVLALDTSHQAGGAALVRGEQILAELLLNLPVTHSRRLLDALDFVLERAGVAKGELQGLAVTLGPGFFTGLRIGLATAQGLALGLGIQVAGVSSLRLLARAAVGSKGTIWAVADARRGLVYAAAFAPGPKGLKRLLPDTALSPERLAGLIEPPALLLGQGARLYAGRLLAPGVELAPAWSDLPRPGLLGLMGARRLARGQGLGPGELRPRYCRPSDAEIRFGLPLDQYRILD